MDLLPWLSGPGAIVLWKAGEWLVGGRIKKGEQAEERAEGELLRKLDELLSKVTTIETEQRVAMERSAAQAAIVREVKERIDGISANYGQRLGTIEQRLAAMEERRRR